MSRRKKKQMQKIQTYETQSINQSMYEFVNNHNISQVKN